MQRKKAVNHPFNNLCFSLLMLMPRVAEVPTSMLVFSCICCWSWEKSQVIGKVRIIQLCPFCPLDAVSLVSCPVYSQ